MPEITSDILDKNRFRVFTKSEMRKNWIRCIKASLAANPNFVQRMREQNMFAVNALAMVKKYSIQPAELGLPDDAYHVA